MLSCPKNSPMAHLSPRGIEIPLVVGNSSFVLLMCRSWNFEFPILTCTYTVISKIRELVNLWDWKFVVSWNKIFEIRQTFSVRTFWPAPARTSHKNRNVRRMHPHANFCARPHAQPPPAQFFQKIFKFFF